VESNKDAESPNELLAEQVRMYDDSDVCKLLLEISLLDLAYRRSATGRHDVRMGIAKLYRVDVEKVQKEVANELVNKRETKNARVEARKGST
jgi:hypothetical protein